MHSYFGIQVVPVSAGAAAQSGKPEGLYVAAVVPGGPSELSGLRAGDIITAVDGEPVRDAEQLALLTLTKKPGESVTLPTRGMDDRRGHRHARHPTLSGIGSGSQGQREEEGREAR